MQKTPLLLLLLFTPPLAGCSPRPSQPPTEHRHWTPADFGGVLSVGLEGHRQFPNGRAHYSDLCASCHRLGPLGSDSGPDLTRKSLMYTPEELLGHMLNPTTHPPKRTGLLDALAQDQVLDLLAFVLSGGDANSPFFLNP